MKSLALTFLLFTFIFDGALAASASPKDIVVQIFKQAASESIIKDTGKQKQINDFVDFKVMATNALGSKRKNITPADFSWFHKSLKEIITRSVYPEAPSFLKKVKIVYRKVDQKNNKATVFSTVSSKGEPTDVDYFFQKIDGNWKIVDIAIDTDSWIESINEQVEESWELEKWTGIKKSLNKRLGQLRKE